jgi:hypothetical protein
MKDEDKKNKWTTEILRKQLTINRLDKTHIHK